MRKFFVDNFCQTIENSMAKYLELQKDKAGKLRN